MKNWTRLTSFALAATLGVTPCFAVQDGRYCIGGDLDHLSKAETKACRLTLDQVRSASVRFHGPAGWHYVVVCDEASWSNLAEFSARDVEELQQVSIDSDEEEHVTYFRAGRLNSKDSLDLQVASEMASLVLGTNDAVAVQKQVTTWLQDEKTSTVHAAM